MKLPLVSVVIVNFNYGRFVAQAVESVFSQGYSNIECLVVDDCSTDDSRAVLEGLASRYPKLQTVFRPSNGGQCAAATEAYERTKGRYVVFMDADDILLGDFVGTHVFVNLSLHAHVGFTCSDMMQSVDDEIVVGSCQRYALEEQRPAAAKLRPVVLQDVAETGLAPIPESDLLMVGRQEREWCWTATTAFMFRRDALDLFIGNKRLASLRFALDVYLARGINAITGSVIINRSLCVYRLHGDNIFSRHPQLEGCLNFQVGGTNDQSEQARRELVDYWFDTADALKRKLARTEDFIEGVLAIGEALPKLKSPDRRYPSYHAMRLVQDFDRLTTIFGLPTVLRWCWRLRVPLKGLVRSVRR